VVKIGMPMFRNVVILSALILSAIATWSLEPSQSRTSQVSASKKIDETLSKKLKTMDKPTKSPKLTAIASPDRKQNEKRASMPLERMRVTSKFGPRIHPILKRRAFHGGVDLAARLNDNVKAISDGLVIHAGRKGALGKAVYVSHPKLKVTSVYGHLNKVAVKRGQKVSTGQVIGFAGTTGRSTGVHLHLTLKNQKTGRPLEPQKFLASLGTGAERFGKVDRATALTPPVVASRSNETFGLSKHTQSKRRSESIAIAKSMQDQQRAISQPTRQRKNKAPAIASIPKEPESYIDPDRMKELKIAIEKARRVEQWFAEGIASRNDLLSAQADVEKLQQSVDANKS
jgi:hypothetical protein